MTALGSWNDTRTTQAIVDRVLAARVEGPLFYANAVTVKERPLALVRAAEPRPGVLVLDLAQNDDLDVETLDTVAEPADELAGDGVELRLAAVRQPAVELLRRRGLVQRVRIEPTLDAAAR